MHWMTWREISAKPCPRQVLLPRQGAGHGGGVHGRRRGVGAELQVPPQVVPPCRRVSENKHSNQDRSMTHLQGECSYSCAGPAGRFNVSRVLALNNPPARWPPGSPPTRPATPRGRDSQILPTTSSTRLSTLFLSETQCKGWITNILLVT